MAFKSIRSRLTAWYVTLLAIILILFSVLLNYFLAKRLHESVDNSREGPDRIRYRRCYFSNYEVGQLALARAESTLRTVYEPGKP